MNKENINKNILEMQIITEQNNNKCVVETYENLNKYGTCDKIPRNVFYKCFSFSDSHFCIKPSL